MEKKNPINRITKWEDFLEQYPFGENAWEEDEKTNSHFSELVHY